MKTQINTINMVSIKTNNKTIIIVIWVSLTSKISLPKTTSKIFTKLSKKTKSKNSEKVNLKMIFQP